MEDLNNSFGDYQRSLRAWAADSFHNLRSTLDTRPSVPSHGARRTTDPSPGRRVVHSANEVIEHADYTYSAAVDRLHSMVQKHEATKPPVKTVQFSPRTCLRGSGSAGEMHVEPPGGFDVDTASPASILELLQKQSAVLQSVESENKYSKGELQSLRVKVTDLVEENRLLHEQIKRITINEILGEDAPITSNLHHEEMKLSQSFDTSHALTKQDYKKWHIELERIAALHTAKNERLEAQLNFTKEELDSCHRELESLRGQLRMKDSLLAGDVNLGQLAAGLCVECAQNEAVVATSIGGSQKQSLEAVTRERDELMEKLMKMRRLCEHLQQEEMKMAEQVKCSVVMVEQAQLEQTQALVQREQLKEELSAMRSRVTEHAEQMQSRLAEERDIARRESAAERDELQMKIKELTSSLVQTQTQLERLARDKVTLVSELQSAQSHIDNFDTDYGKATDSMKMSMTQATFQRNSAMQEIQKIRKEMSLSESEHEQVQSRLKKELKNVRERLEIAERHLLESREECVLQTNNLLSLEKEVQQVKLAKESLEKNRSDDLKMAWQRSEQREQELNMMIDTMQTRHDHATSELNDLVQNQANLVQKLRDECRHLAAKLEEVTKKYKNENKRLKTQNDQARTRLSRSLQRLQEVEDQHAQHADMNVKMRERLAQMEKHSQDSAQQIMELLARQSHLMRQRQALGREVDFLRKHFTEAGSTRHQHFVSSDTGNIDAILCDIVTDSKEPKNVRSTLTFSDDEEKDE